MVLFSERYGYTKVEDVIITECLPTAVLNHINRVLLDNFGKSEFDSKFYHHFWHGDPFEFNKSTDYFYSYLRGDFEWHEKLSAIEFLLEWLKEEFNNRNWHRDYRAQLVCKIEDITNNLNSVFEKFNYGYRLIDNKFTPVTNQEEIQQIKEALNTTHNNVKNHIQAALDFLTPGKQDPRNSIKESISAVECLLRGLTGKNTFGKALDSYKTNIPQILQLGFEKLYAYTNDPKTGIRHALMDDSNPPTNDEAIFMLASCSSFINYITKKSNSNTSH